MKKDTGGKLNKGISVLIAHPYSLLRQTLSTLLKEAGFDVMAQVRTESELHRMAIKHKPDILLLDWRISDNYLETVHRLKDENPDVSLVILTQPQSSEVYLHILQAGARGYLSLDLSPQDFISSLNLIAKGNIVVSSDLSPAFNLELTREDAAVSEAKLSEREREVLNLISCGATNREVAGKLYISEHTVKVHLRSVLNKLGLRNRQQAAVYAAQKGLISNDSIN